jgi:hypothetical protein
MRGLVFMADNQERLSCILLYGKKRTTDDAAGQGARPGRISASVEFL